MRLYGKKLIRNQMGNIAKSKMETRDAVLWDILEASKVCRCKIQGSSEYIIAHYPQHWESTPAWMRPGAAIRITHLGGERGKVEVVGPGRAIPTAISGSSQPVVPDGEDCVLTGCMLKACGINRMAVLTEVGTFRVSGTIYTLPPMTMGDANFLMGDGGKMSNISAVTPIPAAGLIARYDMLYVGADYVVHRSTAGYAASADEEPPRDAIGNYPGHVLLGWVLVPGNAVAISDSHINADWAVSSPNYMTIVLADSELSWGELSTAVTVKVWDQFGVWTDAPSGVFNFLLEIIRGNGQVYSSQSGMSTVSATYSGEMSGYFTYYRDNLVTDVSPALKVTLDYGGSHFEAIASIILLDAGGDPM